MTFLPVAGRELLVASHSPWLPRLRILSTLATAVLSGFFIVASTVNSSPMAGAALFNTLGWVAFAGVFLAGVALTADCISSERRTGTLGFLFLTELTGLDILAGKLASAWIRASTMLVSMVPFLALGLFMGGVTGTDMIRMVLSLINLLWVSLVFGISVSTRCTKSGTAVLLTCLGLLAVNVAAPILAGISARAPFPWNQAGWINHLSPAAAWWTARSPIFAGVPDPFWWTLLISHAGGWALFLGAALTLPRTLDSTQGRRWFHPPLGLRPQTDRRAATRSFAIDNPVALLCRPNRWIALFAAVAGFVPLGLILIGVVAPQTQDQSDGVFILGIYLLTFSGFVLKVLYAWHCCEAFTGLREFGLEPILGTGLPERAIPVGVFRAGRRTFLPAGLAVGVGAATLFASYLTSGMGGAKLAWAAGFTSYSLLVFVLDFQTLGWWSARTALMKPGFMSPFSRTVVMVLGIRILFFCVPDLLITLILLVWGRDGFLTWLRMHSRSGAGTAPESR
jgi:hypothetical protein